MKKKAYFIFSYRSGDTGMKLFREFQKRNLGGYDWFYTKGEPKQDADLVFRWGNSYSQDSRGGIQINSQLSNKCASNKLTMATLLHKSPDPAVKFPEVVFDLHQKNLLEEIKDENGKVYIRSSAGLKQPVRYDSVDSIRYGDVYATKNTKKLKEFRVHVVGEEVICTFEKVPYEGRYKTNVYKDDNCRFRRDDNVSFGHSERSKAIRQAAIGATKTLGLVTSGIDIFELETGEIVIGEVNSAPGINTPGIQRWADACERMFTANGWNAKNEE